MIPILQFESVADNKGILVVGNYGRGKSHLLSLISGLAEYTDMATVVRDKDVAKAAKAISGKFKVVRVELPAAKKSLRNIICFRLEEFMSSEGMSFSFPADDQVKDDDLEGPCILGQSIDGSASFRCTGTQFSPLV